MKTLSPQISRQSEGLRARMKYISTGSLCAALLVASLSGCGNSATPSSGAPASSPAGSELGDAAKLVPDSMKNKTLKVAVLGDYPPAIGFKQDGVLMGIGPDLFKAVGADLGLKVEVEVASLDTMIPGLQSNRYDVANPLFQITDERRKVLDFVPINKSGTAFAVRADSGISIKDASDLCGRSVAVLQGSVQGTQLTELNEQKCKQAGKPEIKTQTFGSNNDVALALSSSRTDVFSLGALTSGGLVGQSNGKFALEPFTYNENLAAIGFKKGSELAPIFTAAMKDLAANGTYQEILEKYNVQTYAVTDFEVVK